MIAELDSKIIYKRPSRAFVRLISHFLFQGRPLTTSHQWLNPILLAQFSAIKNIPIQKNISKPIYILGTGRSGTTILGKILAVHPEIGFLNEPKALWHSINAKDDLIGSYSNTPGSYWLDASDVTPQMIQSAHRLYAFYTTLTRSKRILDKYPEMIFRVAYLKSIFSDAQFIIIVRNGWDTIHSVRTWSEEKLVKQNGETHNWWGANNQKWQLLLQQVVPQIPSLAPLADDIREVTRQEDMAAVEWIATMYQGQQVLNQFPKDVIVVRYEAMTTDPRKTMARLIKFCGLSEDSFFSDYAASTLSPNVHKGAVELHPALQTPFADMMKSIGYSD